MVNLLTFVTDLLFEFFKDRLVQLVAEVLHCTLVGLQDNWSSVIRQLALRLRIAMRSVCVQ